MEDKEKTCKHCGSKHLELKVWGRTEFWYCKDCKQETEPAKEWPDLGYSPYWAAKDYYEY